MSASEYRFNPSESPNYGFTVPDHPSRYLRAFLALIDAYHAWDLDRIIECFDEQLEHRILPSSLGRPVLNKRQYREYLKGIMPLMKSFRVRLPVFLGIILVTDYLCISPLSVFRPNALLLVPFLLATTSIYGAGHDS